MGETDESRAIIAARMIQDNPDEFLTGWTAIEALLVDYHESKRIRGISARWIEDEGYALRQFFAGHSIARPRDITTAKAQAWLAGKGSDTGEQYRAILSRFCRWLVAGGKIPANPCDAIPKTRKRPRARKRFLSRDECRRLIDACEDQDLKAAVLLALHAGLRKGEVLAAKWSWVDLSAGLLHVQTDDDWTPKDRSDRTIPLSGELRDFLADRQLTLKKDYLLGYIVKPDKPSEKWRNRWEFRKPYAKAMAAAGIEGASFHDLRRTFASLHVVAGTPLYVVAKWLGDGHAVVERHYAHLVAQDSRIDGPWK